VQASPERVFPQLFGDDASAQRPSELPRPQAELRRPARLRPGGAVTEVLPELRARASRAPISPGFARPDHLSMD
jgi:hypothetical protein